MAHSRLPALLLAPGSDAAAALPAPAEAAVAPLASLLPLAEGLSQFGVSLQMTCRNSQHHELLLVSQHPPPAAKYVSMQHRHSCRVFRCAMGI